MQCTGRERLSSIRERRRPLGRLKLNISGSFMIEVLGGQVGGVE
jgi:hypothetical protein